MIKRYRIPLLVLVVLLQTAALVGMVAIKQRTLIAGMPVLLKTEPVDPRSLFRGDYVILNYAISSLPSDRFPATAEFRRHDTIHVLLRQGNEYWEPVSIHHDRPVVPENHVAILGRVEGDWGIWRDGENIPGLNVRYGIESYFVPEGEGREIELPRNEGKVSILVAVDGDGAAAIKAVLVDGIVRYEESLF